MSRDLIIKNLSTALGVLTLNFGHVEHAIQVLCCALISEDGNIGLLATCDLSFSARIKLARALLDYRNTPEDLIFEADALLTKGSTLEQKRNTYIHSVWLSSADEKDAIRWKTTAKKGKLSHAWETVDEKQLQEIVAALHELNAVVFDLIEKLIAAKIAYKIPTFSGHGIPSP
jgi:hypothetical protein